MNKNIWLPEANALKGLAILLVVFGHIANRSDIVFNHEIYVIIKNLIYIFHMPLFFFVSGVLAFKSIQSKSELHFFSYIKLKVIRILYPYFIFGIITIYIKLFREHSDFYNYISTIGDLFYNPLNPYIGSVWFLYVLFTYLLILPFLVKISKKSFLLLLVPLFILYFIDLKNSFFGLNLSVKYLIFFVLGGYYFNNRKMIIRFIEKINHFILFILIILFFLFSFLYFNYFYIFKFIATILAILISLKIMLNIKGAIANLFNLLGDNTMTIYLISPFIITLSKLILMKISLFSDYSFFIAASVITFLAILIPILLKKNIFNKFNFTKKLME